MRPAPKLDAAQRRQDLADHLQMVKTDTLCAALRGEIDVEQLLREELAGRGVDGSGQWIGFKAATELHSAGQRKKAPEEALKSTA